MILRRNVMPSMRGISRSRMMTSGNLVLETTRRHERIRGRCHHLDIRIIVEDRLQDLAHRRRIVHDQHANFPFGIVCGRSDQTWKIGGLDLLQTRHGAVNHRFGMADQEIASWPQMAA